MTIFSISQLSRRHDLPQLVTTIKSADQEIEKVNNFEILGIRFNKHLGWTEHVNSTTKSCFATLRTLKQFKNSASWHQRKILAESLILSKLNYGKYCCLMPQNIKLDDCKMSKMLQLALC